MKQNTTDNLGLAECYLCTENKAVWCKICKVTLCDSCHKQHEQTFFDTEYLSPHQVYNRELECARIQLWYYAPKWLSETGVILA